MINKTKAHLYRRFIALLPALMLLASCGSSATTSTSVPNTSSIATVSSSNVTISSSSSSVQSEPFPSAESVTSIIMPEEPLIFFTEKDIATIDFAIHEFAIGKAPYYKTDKWVCSIRFSDMDGIDFSFGPYGEDESGVWYVGTYDIQNGLIAAEVHKVGFEPPAEEEPVIHLTISALWNPDSDESTAVLTFNRPSSSTEEFDEWFEAMYEVALPYQLHLSVT